MKKRNDGSGLLKNVIRQGSASIGESLARGVTVLPQVRTTDKRSKIGGPNKRPRLWTPILALIHLYILILPLLGIAGELVLYVPAHGLKASMSALQNTCEGHPFAPLSVVTVFSLQWWRIAPDGKSIQRIPGWTDSDLRSISDLARTHRIRIIMSLANCWSGHFDFSPVREALKEPDVLAKFIMAEVRALNLDGCDLDFELSPRDVSKQFYENDKIIYKRFIGIVSEQLHADHKLLSIDTFPEQYGLPCNKMWKDLSDKVNMMTIMGYEYTSANASNCLSYQRVIETATNAGISKEKILIGMKTSMAAWGSGRIQMGAEDQIRYIRANYPDVGISLWESRLQSPAWRSSELWNLLADIKTPRRKITALSCLVR